MLILQTLIVCLSLRDLDDAKEQRQAMNEAVTKYRKQWVPDDQSSCEPCVSELPDDDAISHADVETAIQGQSNQPVDMRVIVQREDYGQSVALPSFR